MRETQHNMRPICWSVFRSVSWTLPIPSCLWITSSGSVLLLLLLLLLLLNMRLHATGVCVRSAMFDEAARAARKPRATRHHNRSSRRGGTPAQLEEVPIPYHICVNTAETSATRAS